MASVVKLSDNTNNSDVISGDADKIPLLKLDNSPLARIKSQSVSKKQGHNGTANNTLLEKGVSAISLNGKVPPPTTPKPSLTNRSTSTLSEKAINPSCNLLSTNSLKVDNSSIERLSNSHSSSFAFDINTLTEDVAEVPQILLKNKKVLEEESKVLSLDWSLDSKLIVTSLQSGHLCIWDVVNKDRIYAVQTPCTWVFSAAFSPSQSLIAAGGLDSKCDVYKIPRGKQLTVETQHVAQHQSYVLSCMFTSSDHQILTASSDKTSGLWDVESSHLIRDFKGHSADVTSLDFQKSSGHCFATGSADHQVGVWDMRTGNCVQSFYSHTDEVNQVRFFPSGDAVASVSDDMTCQLFDLRMNARLALFKRNSILFPACSLDFSLNGRLLFVGYGDHSFHVWDTLKGSHCGCMYSHENKVNVLKLSSDGSYLATGSWDQSVKLWS
ncbi:guanine nucleotide-binding protein subunit beta-5-like [Clytia hemisphaerica]|uniref:Uncharacterized protein n=1 Tax=Clytia hemisphaerica TaxID=252671 RepID=A0A7M5TYW5_9CNID|eukprot:TCONS_00025907-protein